MLGAENSYRYTLNLLSPFAVSLQADFAGWFTIDFPLAATVMDEISSLEATGSLWAIRISLLLLVGCLSSELLGVAKTNRRLSGIWLIGAILALCHSIGALFAFHHGSHTEAFESTAQQTQELMGFRFGAGLYVNYVFVAVWLCDALLRQITPIRYASFPKAYHYSINAFLLFIAVNGAIVFKSGWVRGIGIFLVCILMALAWRRYQQKSNSSPLP